MYRISVTTLEKFRRYLVEESKFDSEEALIQSLRGEFKGNAKTRFGSAYEKIIENPNAYAVPGGFRVDNHFFNEDQARPAVEFSQEHPRMIFQIPATKIFEVGNYLVQMSGKVDAIEGIQARDFKCKFRSADWQEYYDSCQWRMYLLMSGLKMFYYDVFEVKGTEDEFSASITDFSVAPCQSTYFMAYAEMYNDCQSLLYRFMNYIEEKNFFSLLREVESPTIINK